MTDSASIAETVLVFVANHAWQSALLALALAGVFSFGARLSAATRHALATVAFLAALVLPLAALLPGAGVDRVAAPLLPTTSAAPAAQSQPARLDALLPSARLDAEQTALARNAARADATPPQLDRARQRVATLDRTDAAQDAVAPSSTQAPIAVERPGTAMRAAARALTRFAAALQDYGRENWAAILFATWALGAGVLLVRMILHAVAAERLRRRARVFAPPAFLSDRLARLRLRVSPEVGGPIVAGLLRPTVILPADSASRYAEHELVALLEHERAHVARGDLALAFAQRVIIALTWWNPAMHWINRRINDECEAACDDAAAAVVGDARVFASALTAQARAQLTLGPGRLAVGAVHGRSQLARRVRRLIDSVATPSRAAARAGAAALALVIAASAIATPRLVAQESDAASNRAEAPATEALNEAIWDHDSDLAAELMARGAPADQRALHAAIWTNDEALVEAILDAGVQADTEALVASIWSGDRAVVERFLDHGAQVNPVDPQGDTPLAAAILAGDPEMVELLLDAGATPDARALDAFRTSRRWTDREIVELLEDAGLDLGVPEVYHAAADERWSAREAQREEEREREARQGRETQDRRALDRAIQAGDHHRVLELIAGGDDDVYDAALETAISVGDIDLAEALIELLSDQGEDLESSALEAAIWAGERELAELLVEHGVELESEAIEAAIQAEDHELAMALVELFAERGVEIEADALEAAVWTGDEDLAAALYEAGAELQPSLLEAAIHAENADMTDAVLELLLDEGVEISADSLEAAIWSEDADLAERLIENGARVNSSALESAIHAERLDLAAALSELMAERGVRIDADALEAAAWTGDDDLVWRLVEDGAGLHSSALEAAIHAEDEVLAQAIAETLIARNVRIDGDALDAAIYAGYRDLARMLIEDGVSANEQVLNVNEDEDEQYDARRSRAGARTAAVVDENGRVRLVETETLDERGGAAIVPRPDGRVADEDREATALFSAIESADVDLVRALIEAGADVDARGRRDETPLMRALRAGDDDVTRFFLQSGANANAADVYGRTPLMIAVEEGDVEIVSELLEAGADPNAVNQYGQTPLLIAIDARDEEIVRLLLECGARFDAAG